MKTMLARLLFLAVALGVPSAWAQGSAADVIDMQALRAAVQADKKAFVAQTLDLTPAEAKKFWPIYDAYQRDLDLANQKVNLTIVALVSRDKPLTDLYAKNLLKDLFEAEEIEMRSRRTLQARVTKALPPKKAARYLQLEQKIRAAQAYEIATTFPLVK